MQKLRLSKVQDYDRAIWLVFLVLVACLVLFLGYYYWDRYVYPEDKSPLARDIERLKAAVQQEPGDLEARVSLAEYYLRSSKYREAMRQTEQVLQFEPAHEGALLVAGVAQVGLNQPKAALDPLARFVTLRKERPMADADAALETAYYFMGESYVKLGRPREAIVVLEAALVINPTDADAVYQLGRAHYADGQPEKAIEQYHKAVRFVPNFTEVYGGMIESYSALEWSDHAIYAQGMQAYCLQDYETAQSHLQYATQALPDFAATFLGLGLTYEKLGNLTAALGAIQRALELDPSDYAARHAHGRILAGLNAQD